MKFQTLEHSTLTCLKPKNHYIQHKKLFHTCALLIKTYKKSFFQADFSTTFDCLLYFIWWRNCFHFHKQARVVNNTNYQWTTRTCSNILATLQHFSKYKLCRWNSLNKQNKHIRAHFWLQVNFFLLLWKTPTALIKFHSVIWRYLEVFRATSLRYAKHLSHPRP